VNSFDLFDLEIIDHICLRCMLILSVIQLSYNS